MNSNELTATLNRFAKNDIALARKRGLIGIAQTKLGTLELTHEAGVYTLVVCGTYKQTPRTLAQGKPAVIVPVLVSAYDVVVA